MFHVYPQGSVKGTDRGRWVDGAHNVISAVVTGETVLKCGGDSSALSSHCPQRSTLVYSVEVSFWLLTSANPLSQPLCLHLPTLTLL